MATSLMSQARAKAPPASGPAFKPTDPRPHVPPEMRDIVDRVVAAGMKIMYSPQMQQERQQAVQSQEPVPKILADNVTGLMLTLDQQTKGGVPVGAIFAAGVMLCNEAATLLTQGGRTVTQNDYNEALQLLYVQLGKKAGESDDSLMNGAKGALDKAGGPQDDPAADPAAPPTDGMDAGVPVPGGAPPAGVAPPAPGGGGMPPQGATP